jgi:uncharacterized membrane protein
MAELVETTGLIIDVVGVVIIVIGAIIATAAFVRSLGTRSLTDAYRLYRLSLGRGILLGLEFLVAGDIIRSVAISPSFESVGVLGLIVLVRTFLSFALEVELEGRWPWQRAADPQDSGLT